MKPCPYCGEQLEENTEKCPFCGSRVEREYPLQTNADYVPNMQQTMSNSYKVLISMLSTIPLIGNLIGIIVAIVYMNQESDADKKSFGKALLIGALTAFLVTGLCCFVYILITMALAPQLLQELKKYQ